jgi:hypothetical protein
MLWWEHTAFKLLDFHRVGAVLPILALSLAPKPCKDFLSPHLRQRQRAPCRVLWRHPIWQHQHIAIPTREGNADIGSNGFFVVEIKAAPNERSLMVMTDPDFSPDCLGFLDVGLLGQLVAPHKIT